MNILLITLAITAQLLGYGLLFFHLGAGIALVLSSYLLLIIILYRLILERKKEKREEDQRDYRDY
ncbi:hypothetical protein CEH05_04675 [Halobacillus halophilus]|uniref:Uncharacterized protein n=1 Tax=Halobacillus halophilus (strain ATCC 35676 / DSM 2266 / JCM 20832 / KCTC 3685 / LMG 17431 / NBRC 102448 / NCIMB 2269) TaxID=866895 RepID=I0JJH5_HALH3|nr:hypothetical protein [Halobacillus halophilus]ASF38450.1 hypothetical protein CEH05_04675 [Halobacillus halophilus]CCG44293.1 hypothetical protein HBHAL_1932 [Halobacillus halophilus DSM 2266]